MEFRPVPLPSPAGWWNPLRHLRALYGGETAEPAPVPVVPWAPAALPHLRQWGAADCPELLLGSCEPATALLPLLEARAS